MTNKQYEHLGRALACEAKLEARRDGMDELCEELSLHLGALAGANVADMWVRNHYGKQFATWHGPKDFIDAVRDIITRDEKNEAEK